MNSVFSNHLKRRFIMSNRLSTKTENIALLDVFTNTQAWNTIPHVIAMLSTDEETVDDDILYIYATNPEIQQLLKWITTNIIAIIHKDSYQTVGVKLRIATGMLNKINIDKYNKMLIHDNLVNNIQQLKRDILNQDLPF